MQTGKNIYIGLDGEMTSANIEEGGRLCQIGVSMASDSTAWFDEDIGWDIGNFTWEAKALEVNGFDIPRITSGLPAPEVDRRLYEFLVGGGADPEYRALVPVGFNVGTFDMPFVRQALPKSASMISRRSVDLNAVCFALEGKTYGGSTPKWNGWKRMCKKYANERLQTMGVEPNEHNAGYDAAQALLAFEWLRERIRETA